MQSHQGSKPRPSPIYSFRCTNITGKTLFHFGAVWWHIIALLPAYAHPSSKNVRAITRHVGNDTGSTKRHYSPTSACMPVNTISSVKDEKCMVDKSKSLRFIAKSISSIFYLYQHDVKNVDPFWSWLIFWIQILVWNLKRPDKSVDKTNNTKIWVCDPAWLQGSKSGCCQNCQFRCTLMVIYASLGPSGLNLKWPKYVILNASRAFWLAGGIHKSRSIHSFEITGWQHERDLN